MVMAQPNSVLTARSVGPAEPPESLPEAVIEAASLEIMHLLRRAAQLAAEQGGDTDLFMQAAWAACLDARPGLREELAEKELRAQLKKLRKRGLVAAA